MYLEEMSRDQFKDLLREAFLESAEAQPIRLAPKWEGGTLILKPGDASLKSKEIDLDVFFHKIVMVRDRLRVMEQKINASKNLSDAEKVELQQYLTRIYGTLTTFNILFSDEAGRFKGEAGKEG